MYYAREEERESQNDKKDLKITNCIELLLEKKHLAYTRNQC